MSIWFRRRDGQGRRYYYSVSVPWFFALTFVAILVALVLPLLLKLLG